MARATELLLSFTYIALCAGQNATPGPPEITNPNQGKLFEFARAPYQARSVSTLDPNNSNRIQDLMRAGNIYLSLQDAIALAIENSLDVQVARYQIPIAATDLLRAKGGGTLRGVGAVASLAAPGVGAPESPLLNAAAGGSTPSTSVPANVYDLSFLQSSTQSLSLDATSGSVPLPSTAGPPLPQYDPLVNGSLAFVQMKTPQASTLETGTNVSSGHSFTGSFQLMQGFSTGTQYSLQYNSMSQNTNTTASSLNPQTNGSVSLTVTQPLLRRFGTAVNRRFITIAKIDQKISRLVFRQQIINVIYGVSRLYYDLVSLYEDLKVKQDTLTAARALYENTKARVEEGTLAEVELTRAEAQVAGAEQDLVNSQGLVEQEEAILKRVLTRTIPRDSYDASVRTLRLQQQSLDVEQARFDAGVSTAFMVILYQSYVAQARSTEVAARGNYFKARAALDRSLGQSIDKYNISMDDAFQGTLKSEARTRWRRSFRLSACSRMAARYDTERLIQGMNN